MGAVSEAVRRHPQAVRSREPTHAVAAIGPRAEFLNQEHLLSVTPCDRHSPYCRLTLVEGWYLLLGVDFRVCTLLHGAEEIARVPFIDFDTRFDVACRDGKLAYTARIACHSTPYPARFPAVEPLLDQRGLLRRGTVGCAECRLARAADILETALGELARDPFFLRVCEERAR
jgi:aminoglycoside N3'-acetyltransferase